MIDKGPNLAEAPSQGAAGVVRYFPKYLAQIFAPVLPSGQSEVSQQGPRFPRPRQRHRGAIADHLEFAEDPELQHVAASAAIFLIADLRGDYAVTTLLRQLSTLVPTRAQTEGADPPSGEAVRPHPRKGAWNHAHSLRHSERAVRPLHCQLETRSLGHRDRCHS